VISARLVCSQQVSVVNKYNIRRRYETHAKRYLGLQGQPRREKVQGIDSKLEKTAACIAEI